MEKRESFSSRLGFLLISAGCAIGLGNVWRFPYIMALEDFLISDNLLPLGSLVYLLFCVSGKGWGWDRFLQEANTGSGLKFPTAVRAYVTWVLPIVMAVIFILGYWNRFFAG